MKHRLFQRAIVVERLGMHVDCQRSLLLVGPRHDRVLCFGRNRPLPSQDLLLHQLQHGRGRGEGGSDPIAHTDVRVLVSSAQHDVERAVRVGVGVISERLGQHEHDSVLVVDIRLGRLVVERNIRVDDHTLERAMHKRPDRRNVGCADGLLELLD